MFDSTTRTAVHSLSSFPLKLVGLQIHPPQRQKPANKNTQQECAEDEEEFDHLRDLEVPIIPTPSWSAMLINCIYSLRPFQDDPQFLLLAAVKVAV